MSSIPTTTQPFLERLSLRLSVSDEVTDYTASGVTILAYQREDAINRAVKERYEDELIKRFGGDIDLLAASDKIMDTYKELQYKLPFTISHSAPDSTALVKPEKIKIVKTILMKTVIPLIQNVRALPLTPDQYHMAKTQKYSNYKPTYINPRFYETATAIEMMIDVNGTKINNGTLEALCLLQPVYQKFDRSGDDIICPRAWESDILDIAKVKLFSTKLN